MTEADRIEAKGVPITLVDGTTRYVRFGMRELKHVEDAFGGIARIGEIMKDGKVIGPTVQLVALGTGIPEDAIVDLLDTKRLNEYSEAINEALMQAFPDSDMLGEAPAPPEQHGSRGAPSTGSQLSATAVLTPPFGA